LLRERFLTIVDKVGITMILLVTIMSYIFCDDPNPDPEFMKLSFWGRYKYFKQQEDKI